MGNTVIGPDGHVWSLFTYSFINETDSQKFSFSLYAIDWAHAEEQLEWLKLNGRLDGQIV